MGLGIHYFANTCPIVLVSEELTCIFQRPGGKKEISQREVSKHNPV